jgi:hypothetical protein
MESETSSDGQTYNGDYDLKDCFDYFKRLVDLYARKANLKKKIHEQLLEVYKVQVLKEYQNDN